MSEHDFIHIRLDVRVPATHARAFLARMTGNDDDIVLAGEKPMRAAVRDELRDGEGVPYEEVEISMYDETDTRIALEQAARKAEADLRTYGPFKETP
jgi:stress response protein YsnF